MKLGMKVLGESISVYTACVALAFREKMERLLSSTPPEASSGMKLAAGT
jgi:hypothetical protein